MAFPNGTSMVCAVTADCAKFSWRRHCGYDGRCACSWDDGAGEPFCDMTADSVWVLLSRGLSFLFYLPVAVYFAHVFSMKLRTSALRCSFTFLTLVWGFFAASCMGVNNTLQFIDIVAPTFSSAGGDQISSALEGLGAMFTVMCCLNVSMVWIEFCLASDRFDALSSKLQLTRTYTLVFMAVYVVLSLILSTFTLVVAAIAYYAVLGLFAIAGLVIIFTFRYGSRRLAGAYLRAAQLHTTVSASQRTLDLSSEKAPPSAISEPDTPAASQRELGGSARVDGSGRIDASARVEGSARSAGSASAASFATKQSEEARVFYEKGWTIVRTARAVTRNIILFLAMTCLYVPLRMLKFRAPMWIFITVLHFAIARTLYAVARYVRSTIALAKPVSVDPA